LARGGLIRQRQVIISKKINFIFLFKSKCSSWIISNPFFSWICQNYLQDKRYLPFLGILMQAVSPNFTFQKPNFFFFSNPLFSRTWMLGSCKRMTRRTIQVYSQSLAKAKKRRIDRPSHILRKACSKTFAAKKISFSDDESFIWGLYNQHSFIKFKLAVGHGPVSDVFLLLISFALYVCMYVWTARHEVNLKNWEKLRN
jgi:hypothetical protein